MSTRLFNMYHVEDKAFLSCSVTGDEMWIQSSMSEYGMETRLNLEG
jgi:hypothetical protein